MDQSFPRPDCSDKPPRTELQRRVDEGEDPRTILEELYRFMQAPLFKLGHRWLKDARDVEDLVQKVFLKMHVNFDTMIAREPARAWVLTVARRELIDMYRRSKRGDLPADFDILERDLAQRWRGAGFEERVETWIENGEPLVRYLLALMAKGALRDIHLRAYWYGVAEGMTQAELAGQLGLTQGRISQLKSEVRQRYLAALYFCEILGIVRAPYREAEIRSHLDLVDLATGLTAADRALLRRAGGAVRRDRQGRPVLLPADAEAAIQTREAGRVVTLRELHDAESRYAAAIPNPTPHCIESPCGIHTLPARDPKAKDNE
jgi:RNA polymerase sigma factor (sigma-70 family)